MSNERPTQTATAPSALNFGTAPAAPTALVPVPPPAPQAIQVAKTTAVALPSSSINDNDVSSLGQNTAGAIDNVSRRLLEAQRAGDTGGMGQKLNALIVEAKGLSPDSLKKKGAVGKILGFRSGAKEHLMAQYDTVQGRITTLVAQIDTEIGVQRNRVKDLDDLYHANYDYYVKLGEAVATGEGAGRVAALAARRGCLPHEVDWTEAKKGMQE